MNQKTKEALAYEREVKTLPWRLIIALRNAGVLSDDAYYDLLYPEDERMEEAERR